MSAVSTPTSTPTSSAASPTAVAPAPDAPEDGPAAVATPRVLLVCSGGGHLAQLHRLAPWWEAGERRWVTFDQPDVRSLLAGEDVVWAYAPTTRNAKNLVRNAYLAWREVRRYRPDVVVSDGAGVALPFFVVARLRKVATVYLEVYDRIDSATLTGKLCRPFSDLFLLQWDEQRRAYPHGTVIGRLY